MDIASTVISSSTSLAEDISSNPPPHIQRCIEELRSLGVTISRHKLYKEIVKAYSPKLRKKRCIGLALDQYDDMVVYKTRLGGLDLILNIPSLLGDSLRYLEDYLHVKGIFRKSPAVSRLRQLEVSLSSGRTLEELQPPPHDVAALVKSFLRSLPDPLFSEQIVSILVQCPSLLDNELRGIQLACTLLSPATLQCLQAVLSLLALVAQHYADNRMNENSLAVVIAPTLFYNRNSLKKPMKEKATTQNIIRVIEIMLRNTKDIATVKITADSDNLLKDRKRIGSLSDMFKVFPRKISKVRTTSQPYPVLFSDTHTNTIMSGDVPGNLPVIKNSVRTKRPIEKYKPLLTEAKRARLLEQSTTMREAIVRRQIQLKDTKLVRRNAFLLRRGIPASGSNGYLVPKTADSTEIQTPKVVEPKVAYPFENIRENLEFKFVSEDIEPAKILSFTKSPQKLKTVTQPEKTHILPAGKQQQIPLLEQTDSTYTTESFLTQEDTSGEMIRSRTEESLEKFASSLLNPDMQTNNSSFDSSPNFVKQPIRSPGVYKNTDNTSNTLPRFSMARRMNQQLNYFQCPENRVHINDKDVLLPSSIHEIYISANGCSSTPIDMLESPYRIMSSLRTPADNGAISTRFGTVPLQRNIRLRDIPEATPVQQIDPYYTEQRLIQTEIPDRTKPPLQHTPSSVPTSQDMATHSFSNSEISVGLTDSETPASFHRQNPIRRSFRKLISPVLPMKREGERDSFDKNNERSNSNGSRKYRPQRRWSLRGMFKSPTPPRPVINTTVISSPIPIKIPFHPVFTQKGPGCKSVPPFVKRPCSKDTPPTDRIELSPTCLIPAEVTPEYAEWFGTPPSIISSEISDINPYAEFNPHKQSFSKEDPFSPPDSLLPHTYATATPSDNISEDFLRDDSFSDTSFDTSPYLLDEESPVIHFPFVEASVFAKPHTGAIKVLPDLPPLTSLKRTKPPIRPATLPRGCLSFRPECPLKEVDSKREVDSRPVPGNDVTIGTEACIETNPLPDVSDCVKMFEAMARPSLGARRNPKVRASFTSFDNQRTHSRLVKRVSMREPDRF